MSQAGCCFPVSLPFPPCVANIPPLVRSGRRIRGICVFPSNLCFCFKETGLAGNASETLDDLALMQAIVCRDRAALAALYDRHSPLLLAICRRVLKDADEADEVLTDI